MDQSMNYPQTQNFIPFVYIVDSPSSRDLFDGYSIGMALRDALRAIRIPALYTLTTNKSTFDLAFTERLSACISQFQTTPTANAYPFIHLCMHGANNGIALTDTTFINWQELRNLLKNHNYIKGYDPYVCMASCNGINASNMAHAYDSAFNFLIGNTGPVLQSDVTAAYLAFYNYIFYKQASIDQAVMAMRVASGDNNFFHACGQNIKNQQLQTMSNPPFPTSNPGWINFQ